MHCKASLSTTLVQSPSGVGGGASECGAVREVLRALGGDEGAWRSMMETLECFGESRTALMKEGSRTLEMRKYGLAKVRTKTVVLTTTV